MKYFKDLLSKTCINTVIILTVFYGFVTLDQGKVASIPFSSFRILLAIGAFIAVSGLVFKIRVIPNYARIMINFVLLLGSVFGIMLSTGQLANKGPSIYIVITFGFAIIYAVIYLMTLAISKWLNKSDKNSVQTKKSENKKTDYKPLYK